MFNAPYFEYIIDPNVDEPIMLILRQIGNTENEFGEIVEWGVQGSDFCRELLYLDSLGKSRIQIWINSVGGSVVDGYSILGGMLRTKTKVDTYNIGVAASTAGWLFEAGRTRDMADYATWMGHNPHDASGKKSPILEKFRISICKIIAERTGKPEDEIATMLNKETYLNAEECLETGFCDTITVTGEKNKRKMQGAKEITDKYEAANAIINEIDIVNKFISNQSSKKVPVMDTSKIDVRITNKLGIDEAASPEMVLKEIVTLQNKITVLNAEKAEKDEDCTNKDTKIKDLQKEYDKLKKQMDDLKAEMEEEEAENRLKDAKDMFNSFATLGKIENKAETITAWVDLAKGSKEDFDKIKNMLTALPVNKEASKIPITVLTGGTGTAGPKNMAMLMAEKAKAIKDKLKK